MIDEDDKSVRFLRSKWIAWIDIGHTFELDERPFEHMISVLSGSMREFMLKDNMLYHLPRGWLDLTHKLTEFTVDLARIDCDDRVRLKSADVVGGMLQARIAWLPGLEDLQIDVLTEFARRSTTVCMLTGEAGELRLDDPARTLSDESEQYRIKASRGELDLKMYPMLHFPYNFE